MRMRPGGSKPSSIVRRVAADPLVAGNNLSTSWSMEFARTKGIEFSTMGPNANALNALLLHLRPYTIHGDVKLVDPYDDADCEIASCAIDN
jgi:hypothetical protein